MQLTSVAFRQGSRIPAKFTCDGENTSPELSWKDAPPQTRSFALIMHDPDAPRAGGFTHWVLYDIPANVTALQPNMPESERVPGIGIQGKNDAGKIGYMGPCPPSGIHRYLIRLHALGRRIEIAAGRYSQPGGEEHERAHCGAGRAHGHLHPHLRTSSVKWSAPPGSDLLRCSRAFRNSVGAQLNTMMSW